MPRLSTWEDVLKAMDAFGRSPNPLQAMKAAGFEFVGETEALNAAQAKRASIDRTHPDKIEAALRDSPPVRVRLGGPKQKRTRRAGGYDATLSLDMTVPNELLAELWQNSTIPQYLSASQTDNIISLEMLRDLCVGVPTDADAKIGRLRLLTAPRILAHEDPGFIWCEARIELPVEGVNPATLVGLVRAEVALTFERFDDRVRLSADALTSANVRFLVDPASIIRPLSADDESELEERLTSVGRLAASTQLDKLSLPAGINLPGPVNTETAQIRQVAAVSTTSLGRSVLVFGFNIVPDDNARPGRLVNETVLSPERSFRLAIDTKFMNDALTQLVNSGAIAEFINKKVASKTPVVDPPRLYLTSASAHLGHGLITINLECAARNACPLGVDLDFGAQIVTRPTIRGGQVFLETSPIDFDVDNTDAILCTLLSPLWGYFGIIVNIAALSILAAINPSIRDRQFSRTFGPYAVPESEQVVKIEVASVQAADGSLYTEGAIRLVQDDENTFVYLRIVTGPALFEAPLVDAEVTLVELDRTPPQGDDFPTPVVDDSPDTEVVAKWIITRSISFEPAPNQIWGRGRTDETGRIRFVFKSNDWGGTVERTVIRTPIQPGSPATSQTVSEMIYGDLPDLAIMVTDKSGAVRTSYHLVALNLAERRVGTWAAPLIVRVPRQMLPRR